MQDRVERFARLERLRREGRSLDDQKFIPRQRAWDDDDDEPPVDVGDIVQRYGG